MMKKLDLEMRLLDEEIAFRYQCISKRTWLWIAACHWSCWVHSGCSFREPLAKCENFIPFGEVSHKGRTDGSPVCDCGLSRLAPARQEGRFWGLLFFGSSARKERWVCNRGKRGFCSHETPAALEGGRAEVQLGFNLLLDLLALCFPP